MNKSSIETHATTLLNLIEGTTTLRPELIDTPERIARSYEELFDGYSVDIPSLFKTFSEGDDQIVYFKDIPFTSFCEHHLLSFSGHVKVAYLPRNNRVIGASKIPRLVLAYAHRLQIQERIARQIADTIMKYLDPLGVAVLIEAEHSCISCRGVKSVGTKMGNSIMLGLFRKDAGLRAEVLSLLR